MDLRRSLRVCMLQLTHELSKTGMGKTLGTPPVLSPDPSRTTFLKYSSASLSQTDERIKYAAVEAGEAIMLPQVLW